MDSEVPPPTARDFPNNAHLHNIPGAFEECNRETPYMIKSIQSKNASTWKNILVTFFSWLTLAGCVVFPGAFKSSYTILAGNNSEKVIQQTVRKIPILVVAGICCGVGTIGTGWLWYLQQRNVVWLVDYIFQPGFLQSWIGLITILTNVYTAQGGHWSFVAKVTIIITSVYTGHMSILYLIYRFWFVESLKTSRDRALEEVEDD